jgi:hypothetical protein
MFNDTGLLVGGLNVAIPFAVGASITGFLSK